MPKARRVAAMDMDLQTGKPKDSLVVFGVLVALRLPAVVTIALPLRARPSKQA